MAPASSGASAPFEVSATYQYSKHQRRAAGDGDSLHGDGHGQEPFAARRPPASVSGLLVGSAPPGSHLVLALHPFDQLVELDRLFGGDQSFGVRKSVLAGGFSSAAGGSG